MPVSDERTLLVRTDERTLRQLRRALQARMLSGVGGPIDITLAKIFEALNKGEAEVSVKLKRDID